ncbi:Alpha/Beta hydrolase protein [Neohortaea acidophila]|uniref:Alpha/Beta hydrolase protein n=1 Tax=Neohortaea acidophila TaxID=245834 RepID=A0A6A6PLV8_9PEZI|nr:Alpha/Beta hydrolase protein [Neohortaea acidophila]KAF2480453.1 Alpha/Beta hydrolase protein [Neohortaea acidophila]
MAAQTAPTQFVDSAQGIRFAYRTIVTNSTSGVPLVCHNHFRGNMDWWDPSLLNALAKRRPVVLFDGQGVGRTAGTVPLSIEDMAEDMIHFVEAVPALQGRKVDLLGYSMGSRVVQAVALLRPDLVRKLVLAGAAPVYKTPDTPAAPPRGQMGAMVKATSSQETKDAFRLALFGDRELHRKHLEAYWARLEERNVEPPNLRALDVEPGTMNQIKASMKADGAENARWPDRLAELKMPALVCNGDNDLVLGNERTLELFHRLPNAQLIMYPKSGHGFLWQYAELFAEHVNTFLDTAAFDED